VIVRSIVLQSCFALAIVAAAGLLSELSPSMHAQAWWPFAQKINFAAVREDADFLREVVQAASALAGGVGLVAVALLLRRFRLVAVGIAALIAWFAVPHFDLLLAEAYPTSFYHSPTHFAANSIVAGQRLFATNCVMCHGADGAGDGPAAKTLSVLPADLTAAHLWYHSDGELFWWIGHGMEAPDGGQAMPGFSNVLDEEQRWAVIDYIRGHNAGVAMRRTGAWMHPPELQARCGNRDVALVDLRGQYVRLVIGAVPRGAAQAGVVTIVAGADTKNAPDGVCVAADSGVARAYAIVSGYPAEKVDGMEFLIDDKGWLRALQLPSRGTGWEDAKLLAAEIQVLRQQPVSAPTDASMPTNMPMNMKM